MTDHKTVVAITQCIRGPSAIKTAKHCHRKKAALTNGTANGIKSSHQTEETTFMGETLEELLIFTNGDLLKASRLLESRLSCSRSQIAALTSEGNLDPTRLAKLRAEQKRTLKLCEGIYHLSLEGESGKRPLKPHHQQQRKSVAFGETKTYQPESDAFIRSSLSELRSRNELEASAAPQRDSSQKPPPPRSTQKSKSRDDLDATVGDAVAVRQRYQELLRSRVKAMWSNFDVAGAREVPGGWHRRRSASLDGSLEGAGKAKAKPAASSTLSRTIPEPFYMTLRESSAGPASLRKSRSLLQFEDEQRRRRDEEDAACRVRFHASPVPAHVRMPLFEELTEQQQTRRKEIRELSRERLREMERPFSFASAETSRSKAESARPEPAAAAVSAATFRANPVPPTSSSGEAVRARQQLREEDELLRQIRIRMRSEETLGRSAAPGEMAQRQRQMEEAKKSRLAKYADLDVDTTSKKTQQQKPSKKSSQVKRHQRQLAGADPPDFKQLHWSFGQELLTSTTAATAASGGRVATKTKPFRLRTEQRRERRPGTAPQAASAASMTVPMPAKSTTKAAISSTVAEFADRSRRTLVRHEEAPPARLTQSAMLREARRDAERQSDERRRRQARSTATRRQVAQRDLIESVRSSVTLAAAGSGKSIAERTRERQEAQREQEEAYKQQLLEMKEKMKQRDLLVVQQAKLIAQQRAQAKYRKTLEEAGLDPKEVDENAKLYQEGDLQSYTQEFEDDNEQRSPTPISDEEELSDSGSDRFGATTRGEAAPAEE